MVKALQELHEAKHFSKTCRSKQVNEITSDSSEELREECNLVKKANFGVSNNGYGYQ